MKFIKKNEFLLIVIAMLVVAVYFILATPIMMDDGFH